MFDFRLITLFCLEKRVSKHKMTMFSKNFGWPWPLWPPLATPTVSDPIRIVLKKLVSGHQGKLFVFRANCNFQGNFSDPLSKMPSRTPMIGR